MMKLTKAAIKFSFCVVARYLTENRRFEQQNPVKIKCSQLNCDQPQKEDLIASLTFPPSFVDICSVATFDSINLITLFSFGYILDLQFNN